ncbi:hypothetical protein BWI15_36050 [Kribbella sp. ALI-6-A]|uniref:hypothetical protein n=1 Tax=Kribbella sp. ALI-6-A TaxID=1933817 RepID=UPI00097BAE30|nr:hypothetical protein [Kribbella sp. ALI-6-A]ONI68408.1 hypothetical protein BWI15_36050 [Kribbella sp. ALI-6-A]
MKNWPALAVTSVLAASLLTAAPAFAGGVAPTDVEIDWQDGTLRHVVVSWKDPAPQENVVVLRYQGETAGLRAISVTADLPDTVSIDAEEIVAAVGTGSTKPLEFAVVGGNQVPPVAEAVSAAFDASTPSAPAFDGATMSATGTTTVRWKPAAMIDTTPDDPLDRTLPARFQVTYDVLGTGNRYWIGGPTTGTGISYTLKSEYDLFVAGVNEWGMGRDGGLVQARNTRLTANVPAWAVYGSGSTRVTGSYTPTDQPRQVVLQARNSQTSPWYVVSAGQFSQGRFAFALGTGGSRQYRVTTQPLSYLNGSRISYGASTIAVSSTTQLRAGAHFRSAQVPVGQTNEARLDVAPKVSTTATLQRWSGTTWTTVGPVAVRNGYGVGRIVTAKPSRVAYRYYVPATTYGGLRFAAAYTETFVNVVVPA